MQLADPPAGKNLELELPARADSVGTARRSLGPFAERAGAERSDVELAVSEAVANSVMHAYPDGHPGLITIHAEIVGDKLLIEIADDGTGLRPNLNSKGLGLGLPLIARLSEDYRVEDGSDGGAVVNMTFRRSEK